MCMCVGYVNNVVHFYRIMRFECVKMHNETGHRNGNYANSDTKIRAYKMFMCHDSHFVSVILKCYPLFCSHSSAFHCAMLYFTQTNVICVWNGGIM